MNKYHLFPLLISLLLLPLFVGAGFQDVQFPQDTNIYLSGLDLTLVVKAGSKVASLTVNPDDFDIGLEAGSWIQVTSADQKVLENSLVTTQCYEGAPSSITIDYTTGGATTVTVTPAGYCLSGGGTPPAGPAAPSEPEPEPTEGEGTATFSEGGQISLDNPEGGSASVDVPGGAVSSDTTFTIEVVSEDDVADAPGGLFMLAGQIYRITATADGEEITDFDTDLTISFEYTDDQISDLEEGSLQVYYYDEDTSSWVALDTSLDAEGNAASVTVNHLTDFALMGGEEEEEEAPPEEEPMTIEDLKERIAQLQQQIIAVLIRLIQLLQERLD
jgi:hypothetical protein